MLNIGVKVWYVYKYIRKTESHVHLRGIKDVGLMSQPFGNVLWFFSFVQFYVDYYYHYLTVYRGPFDFRSVWVCVSPTFHMFSLAALFAVRVLCAPEHMYLPRKKTL